MAARKVIALIYCIVYKISNKKICYNSLGDSPSWEVDEHAAEQ
jgi:hypothetical protein